MVVFLPASSGRKEMRSCSNCTPDAPPWHLPHEVRPACAAVDRAQCGYRHAFLKRLLSQPRYCAYHNLPRPLQLSRLASALVVAQPIAASPYGLDIVVATRRLGELFAKLADEDVDDFDLGLVHPAVEMVQEHLLS